MSWSWMSKHKLPERHSMSRWIWETFEKHTEVFYRSKNYCDCNPKEIITRIQRHFLHLPLCSPFCGFRVSFMKKNKKHIKSSRNRVKSSILKQFIFSYQTSVYVFQFELRWEKLSIGYDCGTRVAIIIV